MLPAGEIFQLKIQRNVFVAGALRQKPLRELTVLPGPELVFGGCFTAREGREGGKERWKKRWRSSVAPLLFYSLTNGSMCHSRGDNLSGIVEKSCCSKDTWKTVCEICKKKVGKSCGNVRNGFITKIVHFQISCFEML